MTHKLLPLLLFAWTSACIAQSYPERPITLVVPFPPGGVADLTARPTAQAMERVLKRPVVVMNRPGASGAIGTASVATAKADGYTLLMTLTSHVIVPEADKLFARVPAYEISQFAPIARISFEPTVLVAGPMLAGKSVAEIVAMARAQPESVSYSSTGYYANGHVSAEVFAQAAGVKLWHVPYPGGGQAVTAVLGSQVMLTTAGPSTASTFMRSDKMRVLGVIGDKRIAALPGVPTLREQGYDAEYYIWSGLFAPNGLPATVTTILRNALRTASEDPDFKAVMAKIETPVAYLDAPEFDAFLQAETKRLSEVVKQIGRVEQRKP